MDAGSASCSSQTGPDRPEGRGLLVLARAFRASFFRNPSPSAQMATVLTRGTGEPPGLALALQRGAPVHE